MWIEGALEPPCKLEVSEECSEWFSMVWKSLKNINKFNGNANVG